MSAEQTRGIMASYNRKLIIIEQRQAEEALKKVRDEERLKASGVVKLFNDLRVEGLFKLDSSPVFEVLRTRGFLRKKVEKVKVLDYKAAIVRLDGPLVEFIFDRRRDKESVVSAYFDEDRLYVEGKEKVFVDENNLELLKNTIGEALAEPKLRPRKTTIKIVV
jgi:hypothetical protein